MSFVWKPGTPLDEAALDRLKQHFPKPSEPPPEAWFMGNKQNYYTWVVDTDPTEVDYRTAETYLQDTGGGIKYFPDLEFAQQRWRYSFHYLLPYLVQHYDKYYLLEDLVTYFMLLYPEGIPDTYTEFRQDILDTLGSAIMRPHFWHNVDLSPFIREHDRTSWDAYSTVFFSPIVSSAMYFCLKYLKPDEIKTWCESIFEINGTHWHYHLLS